jgi:SAM-dependent methyltransferase
VAAATAADGGRRIMSGAESPWRGRGEGWRRPGAGNPAHRHLRYPLYLPSPALTPFERLVSTLHWSVVKCTVCGGLAPLYIEHENLRETGICARCHARTRHRQLAYVVCHSLSTARGLKLRNLRDVARLESLVVYNTESKGAIHDVLSRRADYLCSEYLDPALASGTVVNGIMHQDLMSLSFPSESIDVVLSSDVFEHVADPYQGHAEVHRVLRPGGRHVFTVPFYQTEFLDEVRATVDAQGNLVHHLEPVYHQDPVRLSEGVLVYTIFSVEMLARLRRIGFRTHVYLLHSYWHGMMGPNGLLFEAIKE